MIRLSKVIKYAAVSACALFAFAVIIEVGGVRVSVSNCEFSR
jgi:hypothetical protein